MVTENSYYFLWLRGSIGHARHRPTYFNIVKLVKLGIILDLNSRIPHESTVLNFGPEVFNRWLSPWKIDGIS